MKARFDILLLKPARDFLMELDEKSRKMVFYILKKSSIQNDPRLFKKLNANIWEFRIRTLRGQIRMLAFFDSRSGALVVCTHGFLKKVSKVPSVELLRAENMRKQYFLENESI